MSVDLFKKVSARFLWLIGWLLFVSGAVYAEQLPIKIYTTADGLPQDSVYRIVRDSRGFLWFCTGEGLARFDGYQFTSYTTDQGLPDRRVLDLLEARDGTYWVATGAGVCRFNPTGPLLFNVYYPQSDQGSWIVDVLVQDRDGAIWCGTHNGLYRLEESAGHVLVESVEIGMPSEAGGNFVGALVADSQGSLWVGTSGSGLYRRRPDGRVEHYTTRNGLPANRVESLLQDRTGQLWVGTSQGLARLVPEPNPSRSVVAQLYTSKDGLVSGFIESLFESADGKLWVGSGGLSEFLPGSSGKTGGPRGLRHSQTEHFRTYTTAQGLSSSFVHAVAEDGDGNLWLGTESGGAMKLTLSGFTTYTESDGLGAAGADAVFEDRAGELCVISSGSRHFINRFDGRRFTAVWPDIPREISNFGWGWNQVTFQDHTGQWWVPTGQGLCRFQAVNRVEQLAHTPPTMVYTTARGGLPFKDVFRLCEDSRGDIWISTLSREANGLTRWERATRTLRSFSEADGLVSLKGQAVTAFGEDDGGNLWIGHWSGCLTRYAAGRFTSFGAADRVPEGMIRSIYRDRSGRLWIASSLGGLSLIDDPTSDRPHFIKYTTAEGLSSNDVWCVTEDRWGHIYVGTGRGLDRLDPETGQLRHYTAADGLLHGKVTSAFRDRNGVLWFGSNVHGLSRLDPAPDPPQSAPPVVISRLRIAGVEYPISRLGQTRTSQIDLGPGQNQLNIDFVGLTFGPGRVMRYQYQLEGADQDWSPWSEQRSVNYANLAPGQYRFLVRAVTGEGLASAEPATITFTILPPFWRRWWFVTLGVILLGSAVYAAHRGRVARLVELERVRTRIATDLHDDIGANLSLIAMLSEVAGGHLHPDTPRVREWFSTIAATSRDSVDAMSDIVWAVNPKRDQLRDLTQRMRRFADDIFGARDIEFHFHAPEPGRGVKAGADLRREVFLIFKESINNMARHSECTTANVDLQIIGGVLALQMTDNGQGFDPIQEAEGNGLVSMRVRAKRLGGTLAVVSTKGHGTTVTLKAPLRQRGRS
jgi:ligand-binding sensor domain-containing protein/signal transduction histidine kinase